MESGVFQPRYARCAALPMLLCAAFKLSIRASAAAVLRLHCATAGACRTMRAGLPGRRPARRVEHKSKLHAHKACAGSSRWHHSLPSRTRDLRPSCAGLRGPAASSCFSSQSI